MHVMPHVLTCMEALTPKGQVSQNPEIDACCNVCVGALRGGSCRRLQFKRQGISASPPDDSKLRLGET